MGLQIEDGTGRGYQVKINSENQLSTVSVNHELQHHLSVDEGQVYQIIGEVTDLHLGTNTLLHITNDSKTLAAVVSYIRLQTPGASGEGGWLPDKGTYFQIGKDTTYSSNGTDVTSVNMNFGSGNTADLTVYKENPSLTGTFQEFDRWYPDTGMMTFNKHGSLILGLDDTLEVRLTTDRPEIDTAYCRITMMLMSVKDHN
jgi:hypothetical protein